MNLLQFKGQRERRITTLHDPKALNSMVSHLLPLCQALWGSRSLSWNLGSDGLYTHRWGLPLRIHHSTLGFKSRAWKLAPQVTVWGPTIVTWRQRRIHDVCGNPWLLQKLCAETWQIISLPLSLVWTPHFEWRCYSAFWRIMKWQATHLAYACFISTFFTQSGVVPRPYTTSTFTLSSDFAF